MLYISCPTCNYFLGQKIIDYETQKNKICSMPNITTEEKDNLLSNLILNLGLRRYCCKMRIMSYKDIVQDILPIINDE
jgi:DNA-directed RNA polymerase subunit N (RpoN/RPB10)